MTRNLSGKLTASDPKTIGKSNNLFTIGALDGCQFQATGSWSPAGRLNVGRTQHTVSMLQKGKILVVGGMGRIKFTTLEQWATDWPRDAYFEIIGVIADAKNTGLQEAPRPEVYFPHTVSGTGPRGIMVRTAGNANLVLPSLSRTIAAVDSEVAISELGPMENILKSSYYAGPQFSLIILGTFGITGLLLVVIGIFSVMAYTVSLQT